MSNVVRQLVAGTSTVVFRDCGRHRLRGSAIPGACGRLRISSTARPGSRHGRTAERADRDRRPRHRDGEGQGRFLLIEGEAGIGKSQLVREIVERADASGVKVVEVAADELVRRPGALAHGLLAAGGGRAVAHERLAAALEPTRNVASVSTSGSPWLKRAPTSIEELARDRPVLVIGEDLQWGDELSTAVFAAIARRCAFSRFSLVGTTRPSPRGPAIDRLIEWCRDGRGEHLTLGALDPVDVHALASSITRPRSRPLLRQRLDATAGNPLYVRELLRGLDDAMALQIVDGIAEIGLDAPLDGLHETLVRRLSWLPAETREVLRYASLLGSAFTLRDVAIVMGTSVIEVAGSLRDASLAGLITGHDERLAFRHDLIREAVYAHIPPAERRDLHRAAGQAMALAGAEMSQIAEQFGRGARVGDREAVDWLGAPPNTLRRSRRQVLSSSSTRLLRSSRTPGPNGSSSRRAASSRSSSAPASTKRSLEGGWWWRPRLTPPPHTPRSAGSARRTAIAAITA